MISWKALVSSAAGFSLIELLIAMTAGLVVMGGAYQGFITQQKIYTTQTQVMDMQQSAQMALAFITRELRMAHTPTSLDPTPGTNSLTYVSVLNAAQQRGFLRSSSDNTLYYLQGALGLPINQLVQTPLAPNISGLTITRTGNLITVVLTARSSSLDPALGTYRNLTLQSQVVLRSP